MAEEEFFDQQELFEHYRFIADPGQSLLRIDKFLSDRLENTSRTRIQNAANAGNILVNNNPVKPNYKVKPGDIVQVVLPTPPREIELIPEDIPLNIVYEAVSYTHLRAHETKANLVCRLLLEKKKKQQNRIKSKKK